MQSRRCSMHARVRLRSARDKTILTNYYSKRDKPRNRVHPKGYVEMLEEQQTVLVSGLQRMYKQLKCARLWTGPTLAEIDGHPLTHEILAAFHPRNPGVEELLSEQESTHALQDLQPPAKMQYTDYSTKGSTCYPVPKPVQLYEYNRTAAQSSRRSDAPDKTRVSSETPSAQPLQLEVQGESLPEITWHEEFQLGRQMSKMAFQKGEQEPIAEAYGWPLECLDESQLFPISQLSAQSALEDYDLDNLNSDYQWSTDCQSGLSFDFNTTADNAGNSIWCTEFIC